MITGVQGSDGEVALAPPTRPNLQLCFTEQQSDEAIKGWKASCGPHSLAASTGRTLEDVRSHLPNFNGWMSPTMMEQALLSMRVRYHLFKWLKTSDPCNGISRIQWEGPHLNPGVPPAVAYKYTHWIAHFDGWVLCTASLPHAWVALPAWREFLKDNYQPWHITHHYRLG